MKVASIETVEKCKIESGMGMGVGMGLGMGMEQQNSWLLQ